MKLNPSPLWLLACVMLLSACASNNPKTSQSRAPVEDRGATLKTAKPAVGSSVNSGGAGAAAVIAPLGIENAGKPGYYTVKQGDTLIRIGLDNGQNWRDLARWNQLDSPSRIETGQVIRVLPPVAASAPVVVTPIPASSAPSTAAPKSNDDLNWIWPTTAGSVMAGFDENKNKGLDIGGKLGDAVLASADGRVVYAGEGLRGYGKLIIIKHNETFLSAYAHNQMLLVKEEQTVTKGQKIAEMGQSDSDKVKLHFEIRRQGKPVDPAQYLPKR